MCDSPRAPDYRGWKGWFELPTARPRRPIGDWVDLTHPLSSGVPRLSSFGPPIVTRVSEMPAQPLNVTQLELIVHVGTHVDSPCHFFVDGPAMEAVPIDRLLGPGVVVGVDKPVDGVIDVADLERARPPIEPGDIVAIDSGWAKRWGTPDWDHHPCLSIEAACWLVDRQVKLVAIDMATPDSPVDERPADFNWPVHRALLGHGVLIAEQVANLRPLVGERVEFVFAPLPVCGADGAPARVLARRIAG